MTADEYNKRYCQLADEITTHLEAIRKSQEAIADLMHEMNNLEVATFGELIKRERTYHELP